MQWSVRPGSGISPEDGRNRVEPPGGPRSYSLMRAVAFDAMGVLYTSGDDVGELLMPFARARGSSLSAVEISDVYLRASLGEMTSARLWELLRIPGEAETIDDLYLSQHMLVPGILALLDELRAAGIRLGCISNDVAAWSHSLRSRHDLERRIDVWTISAEVGARKPDAPIYKAFLRTIGLRPEQVVFVDDRPANVDAAAALGFRTVLVDFAGVLRDEQRVLRSVNDLGSELRAVVSQ